MPAEAVAAVTLLAPKAERPQEIIKQEKEIVKAYESGQNIPSC